ncbi:MAG TPA: sulfotransferase, partial [Acidimicrobiales bacterium]
YALQLRVLSASSPAGTTWALKSPSHLGHLDALLGALPDATVVVCHRDPREAVASYASLIHALRRPYAVDADPAVAGRQALERAAVAMGRALDVRARAGGAFVDVSYPQLERDPVGAVRGVYAAMGRPVTPELEAAMAAWAASNPRHRHGPHRYDLARFRLDEAEVLDAFAAYLDQYGALVG